MSDLISRQAAIDALKNDMASLDHIIKGMSANDVRLDAYVSQRNQVNYDIYTINNLPAVQSEQLSMNLAEVGTDCISRQAATDKLRRMQTYKLFSGDDMLLIDQAGAMTELMMLPSAQPERKRGKWIEYDTMTIRSPYLFQLWKATQTAFADRKKGKEQRIAEGKKPLKADLKPLELNTLFKRSAYKEDDTVLEIATYITNVLLNAGKGAHKTKIKYRTLINNCPRLRERLAEIDRQPKETDGKKINKTAHYNSALRKIARAYTLIMTPEKCDALKCFEFIEFSPTKEKGGKREFIPPTKSTLDEEIYINWRRIDPDDD